MPRGRHERPPEPWWHQGGWIMRAACKGLGDLMFDVGREEEAKAKAVCGRCPVVAECRARADRLERTETRLWGVWGAETPDERRARRRSEAAGEPVQQAPREPSCTGPDRPPHLRELGLVDTASGGAGDAYTERSEGGRA